MRGVKAKALRRRVYGDLSQRERKYTAIGHTIKRMVTVKDKDGKEKQESRKFIAQEIRCVGPRAAYQAAKRE